MLRRIETEDYIVKLFFIFVIIVGVIGIIITAFIDIMSVVCVINLLLFLILVETNLIYNIEMEDYYECKEVKNEQ